MSELTQTSGPQPNNAATAMVAQAMRRDVIMAVPTWMEPAFDDPESVLTLIRREAPYALISTLHGYDLPDGLTPWFRAFWATNGEPRIEGAESLLHNRHFIDATRQAYRADIVRPMHLLINLTGPMADGVPHLDLPTFRGLPRDERLTWLLMCMGYSKLFLPWAVPVGGVIAWFHTGKGGKFEYWPDGPDAPSQSATPPMWNCGLAADNDYMYHRVTAIGDASDYVAPDLLSSKAQLTFSGDGGWEVRDDGVIKVRYRMSQVRISLLWKSHVFADDRAEGIYLDHSQDLSLEQIVDVFSKDLSRRGIPFKTPTDPLLDSEWRNILCENYQLASLKVS